MTTRRSEHDERDEDEKTLQLREEELRARTRPVEAGEVRVEKDVVEEERSIDVPVTREEVVVERRPVDRRPADVGVGSDETVRVPVRDEQVEVDKEAVVTEEIEVGKREVQETERVTGDVRREEARIEHEGDIARRDRRRP